MQVLQHHHHRGSLSAAHQQGTHGVEHLQLVQTVAGPCACRAGLLDPGQQPAEAGRGRGDLSQQFRIGRIVGKATQRIDHGQVGKADVAELHTAADKHPHPAPRARSANSSQQTGLAHPSIASQQHDLRPALLGPIQCRLKPTQLISPADERLGS